MSKIIEDYLKYLADDIFEFEGDTEEEVIRIKKPKHPRPKIRPGNLRVGAAQGRNAVFSSSRSN